MIRLGHFIGAIFCFACTVYFWNLAGLAKAGNAINPLTGQLQRSSGDLGMVICLFIAVLFGLVGLYNLAAMGGE